MNFLFTKSLVYAGIPETVNFWGVIGVAVIGTLLFWEFYLAPWYYRTRASRSLKRNDYDRAILSFDKALKKSPRDARLWFGKGSTFYRAGRWSESLDILKKAYELDPRQSRILLEMSLALRKMGRYDEALDEVNKVVECNEYLAMALLIRCAIEIDVQNFDKAEEDCDRLLMFDDETVDAQAYNYRGIARLMLNRVEDALADFETACLLDPKSSEPRAYCAAACFKRGLFEKTILICNTILRSDSENALAYYYRGLSERALGRENAAEYDLKKFGELKRNGTKDTIAPDCR